jgi:N-acetylneuraminic acid mutarotase
MTVRAAIASMAVLLSGAACGGDESPAPAQPETPAQGRAASSSTKGWKPLHDALLRRTEVGAARIGGSIYVVGGFLPSRETTGAVERYDIESDRWKRIAPMPIAVNHPAVASHRGRLYVYGGYTDSSFAPVTGALQRYDPRGESWTLLANSPHPRAAAALAAVRGRLYAVGGTAGGEELSALEVFELSSGRWHPGPPMGVAREHIAATVAGGDVYVFGGRSPNKRVVERLRPGSGTWERMPPLLTARSGIAAATVAGRPVVFGGEGGQGRSSRSSSSTLRRCAGIASPGC